MSCCEDSGQTWPWEGERLCRTCWRAALDAFEDRTGVVRTAGVLASIVATEKERRPRSGLRMVR